MDRIYVEEMEFYGYHGVFPEENSLGQRFIVSLILELDLEQAGKTDQLKDSVNYAEVYSLCKKIVEGEPKKLLEAVAENIAGNLLKTYPQIYSCNVKVMKPNPPIPGKLKSVAVEIKRTKS
mgnify:CR=1 FL=1